MVVTQSRLEIAADMARNVKTTSEKIRQAPKAKRLREPEDFERTDAQIAQEYRDNFNKQPAEKQIQLLFELVHSHRERLDNLYTTLGNHSKNLDDKIIAVNAGVNRVQEYANTQCAKAETVDLLLKEIRERIEVNENDIDGLHMDVQGIREWFGIENPSVEYARKCQNSFPPVEKVIAPSPAPKQNDHLIWFLFASIVIAACLAMYFRI
jgi:hypothetical protein